MDISRLSFAHRFRLYRDVLFLKLRLDAGLLITRLLYKFSFLRSEIFTSSSVANLRSVLNK